MKVVEVPEWQKALAQELRKAESEIDDLLPAIPAPEKAKAYVCLAYDWYRMGAIEEGQKLIWKAHHVCPTYYEKEGREHMAESPTFAFIMNSIALLLADIVRNSKK